MKTKCICTHCGKKQIATEINYSLEYVSCKVCKKESSLKKLNPQKDEKANRNRF
jgi:hypothetical protein